MIRVRVPATSANLGVGYDCLGIALDDFATVTFEVIDQGVVITGCDEAYCNEDNLFYRAFLEGLRYMGKEVPGIHIHIDSDVPFARGMGSSATCIVAGIAGANALFEEPMNKYEIFDVATRMEGHPDNIAPAIFGGLCVSFMDEGKPNMIKYGIKKDMIFVTMIPDYEVSTKSAREVLPDTMSYADAVYQMGRCAALAKAMEIGNPLIIKKACRDKMQEPYRRELIAQYFDVKTVCEECGAITMFISGSGSTMIALTNEEETAQEIKRNIEQTYSGWSVRLLHATYDGVQSEVL